MYGTIALMKPKAGQEDAVVAMHEEWWNERQPKVKGARAAHLYRNTSNPSELMLAVVFDSKADYEANAADPEQDQWYQRLAEHLEGEPRWIDGDVLASHTK